MALCCVINCMLPGLLGSGPKGIIAKIGVIFSTVSVVRGLTAFYYNKDPVDAVINYETIALASKVATATILPTLLLPKSIIGMPMAAAAIATLVAVTEGVYFRKSVTDSITDNIDTIKFIAMGVLVGDLTQNAMCASVFIIPAFVGSSIALVPAAILTPLMVYAVHTTVIALHERKFPGFGNDWTLSFAYLNTAAVIVPKLILSVSDDPYYTCFVGASAMLGRVMHDVVHTSPVTLLGVKDSVCYYARGYYKEITLTALSVTFGRWLTAKKESVVFAQTDEAQTIQRSDSLNDAIRITIVLPVSSAILIEGFDPKEDRVHVCCPNEEKECQVTVAGNSVYYSNLVIASGVGVDAESVTAGACNSSAPLYSPL